MTGKTRTYRVTVPIRCDGILFVEATSAREAERLAQAEVDGTGPDLRDPRVDAVDHAPRWHGKARASLP